MDKMNYVQLILTINGALLLMVGYFVNRLVGKVDKTAEAITNIDKSVAIIAEKTKQHEARLAVVEATEKQLRQDFSAEMGKMKETLHKHGNLINGFQLCMEGCSVSRQNKHKD